MNGSILTICRLAQYVTKAEKDKGAFKTPMLRSMSETAPYMHDGALKTLTGHGKTILP